MLNRAAFLVVLVMLAGCVSSPPTPTPVPPPTLPIATGIPVTPKPATPRAQAEPTATVETLPTPENTADLFRDASALLKGYQPPDTDPKPLYDALAKGIGEFLAVTANGDVSLQGQPALDQVSAALSQLPNLPDKVKAQAAAIHTGDDQGGSRDRVYVAIEGVMGLPIIALERLGNSYEALPPVAYAGFQTPDERYFYISELSSRDVTGDETPELIYGIEYPGASGSTNALSIERWLPEKQELHPIFRADLIDWAGESDYQIQTTADAASLQLTFPWFGAFDHKLLAHPTATQTWEYDDAQDRFVRVSQTIQEPKTPRQTLNAGEYAFRNGDLQAALALYERAWNDTTLQKEDFGDSKADPQAFAKFRAAMVLELLGRDAEAKKLLTDAQKSGEALASVANTFVKNNTGKMGVLRGWTAMANAGDLYQSIYDGKAGNLDFPFEASEIYFQGGIVAALLNLNGDAAQNPAALWQALDGLGFKSGQRAAADLNGDGTNEFLLTTQEGGTSPNQAHSLWFIYNVDKLWRARKLDIADTVEFQGDAVALPNGKGRAIKLKLPDGFSPNEIALTWNAPSENGTTGIGSARIVWLDAKTLEPRANNWTAVGGGPLPDDF